jgi:hypothetical protein
MNGRETGSKGFAAGCSPTPRNIFFAQNSERELRNLLLF